MKMDKEECLFRRNFQAFPSSFNLEIKDLKGRRRIEIFKNKLVDNIESDEYVTTAERIRVFDLLSYLAWIADEREAAYSYNKKALELDKENIVSLSDRLWMRREDGYISEANDELKNLVILKENKKNLLLTGKAEMAFAYSVFGPFYHPRSIQMLEDVIRDRSVKDIDPITLTLWKLDLGIIYRMQCNSGNMPRQGWEGRDEEDCIKRGAELLYEVARSKCSARWKGRCWASLAELVHVTSKGVNLNKYRKEELFPKEIKETNLEILLDEAMKTCGEDSHVLKICGKLYKYLRKLDKAEEILKKSLTIKNTSLAHHHLALVLKQRLADKLFRKKLLNNGKSNISDTINTNIHHKTFSADNVPCQSLASEYYGYSGDLSETNRGKSVSTDEKIMSSTSKTEESVKSSPREANSNLQHTSTRQVTRACAKGFNRVFSIPEDEENVVQEILFHLDEAIKFGNTWASLDKGIILRQRKKYKEAYDVFLKTLKLEENISAIVEVSCYENLGACCRDIAEQETDSEHKKERERDAVIYWRKALEKIASKENKALHFPKEEWMSYPELKNLFEHRQTDIAMLKELVKLGKILERPAETRSLYREISESGDKEANDPTLICSEIKMLLKENQCEEAVQMLENILKQGIEINKRFCKLVYVESALYFASVGNTEMSRERFRQASDAYIDNTTAKSNFDIFFLYDEDTEVNNATFVLCEKLEDFLSEKFALRITSNSKNVDPRKQRWADQAQQMECSKYIVLLLDKNEAPRGDLEYFIGIAQGISKEKKSILNIILVDKCTCPLELTVFHTMHFESQRLQRENDFTQWIRDFIFHLFDVDENERVVDYPCN